MHTCMCVCGLVDGQACVFDREREREKWVVIINDQSTSSTYINAYICTYGYKREYLANVHT